MINVFRAKCFEFEINLVSLLAITSSLQTACVFDYAIVLREVVLLKTVVSRLLYIIEMMFAVIYDIRYYCNFPH